MQMHTTTLPESRMARMTSLTPPQSGGQDALMMALAAERPIAFNANLARLVGEAKSALLLSQLMYWTRVGVHIQADEGWIQKSRDQWTLETGLSRYEQETARKRLARLGFIEECMIGMPAKRAYRVKVQALSMALAQMLKATPVQWSLWDVRSNAEQVRALLGRSVAFYKVMAELTGSVTQAVFVARALATQKAMQAHAPSPDLAAGWWVLNTEAWQEQTGLSPAQLQMCKQDLCHKGYLKHAWLEYPRKRHVLLLDMHTLGNALVQLRMQATQEGRVTTGLLGVLSRGLQPVVSHQVENHRTNPTNKESNHLNRSARQKLPSVYPVDTRQELPSEEKSGVNPDDLSAKPRDADFANLGGGFYEGTKTTPTHAENTHPEVLNPKTIGGFSRPDGGFYGVHRMEKIPLHARAVKKTTVFKTTTTPPTPSSGLEVSPSRYQPIQHPGGGGGGFHGLIWPEPASGTTRLALQHLVSTHRVAKQLDMQRLQLLMDELAAGLAKGRVKDDAAAAYLGALLAKEAKGELDVAAAYDWQARRAAKLAAQPSQAAGTSETPQHVAQQDSPALPVRLSDASLAQPCVQALTQPKPQDDVAHQMWAQVLDVLRQRHDQQLVDVWLKNLPVQRVGQDVMEVAAKRFKLDFIKQRFAADVDWALAEVARVQGETAGRRVIWVSQLSASSH